MADILHRLSIDAAPARVREFVATPAGIEQWWTGHTVGGEAGAGGTMQLFFGGPEPAAVVKVNEDTPHRIVWHIVEGPPDWLDTDVIFTFKPTDNGGTTLLFSHIGWHDTGEFMANCSSEWASYLIGLKAGLEGGSLTPFPIGQVSRWGWRMSALATAVRSPAIQRRASARTIERTIDMAKFIYLYRGAATPTPDTPEQGAERMAAFQAWIDKVDTALVDIGSPFGTSASVRDDGTEGTASELIGYTIVEADDLDHAKALTGGLPFLSKRDGTCAIEIFELLPM